MNTSFVNTMTLCFFVLFFSHILVPVGSVKGYPVMTDLQTESTGYGSDEVDDAVTHLWQNPDSLQERMERLAGDKQALEDENAELFGQLQENGADTKLLKRQIQANKSKIDALNKEDYALRDLQKKQQAKPGLLKVVKAKILNRDGQSQPKKASLSLKDVYNKYTVDKSLPGSDRDKLDIQISKQKNMAKQELVDASGIDSEIEKVQKDLAWNSQKMEWEGKRAKETRSSDGSVVFTPLHQIDYSDRDNNSDLAKKGLDLQDRLQELYRQKNVLSRPGPTDIENTMAGTEMQKLQAQKQSLVDQRRIQQGPRDLGGDPLIRQESQRTIKRVRSSSHNRYETP